MQSPRFNLDDVNDSIVIFFFSLFSDGREWKGGWGGRGHKMSGLGRVAVREKAQMTTVVRSCSQAFTALHIIRSYVVSFFSGLSRKN